MSAHGSKTDIWKPFEDRDAPTAATEFMIARAQLILWICFGSGAVFSSLELAVHPTELPAPFYVKCVGLSLCLAGLAFLRTRLAERHAASATLVIVCLAYVLTALSGMSSPSREYATTAVAFVAAALTTATLLPWSVWSQACTVAVGVLSLAVAVWWSDGNLGIAVDDPGAAVLFAFFLSVATTYELQRYRAALSEELGRRREAESSLRLLNAELERRVADRTARLEKAQELARQHQERLAHVLRVHTVGEMAAALAHEINQPLCAIANYAAGAARRLRNGGAREEDILAAFDRIADEGLRAGEVIRDLRELVRKEDPAVEPVDINRIVADAARLLEPKSRFHGVTVRLAMAPDLPTIMASGLQIEQVMINLMLNGVEAIDATDHRVREIEVETRRQGDVVEVAVRDSGLGFAPAMAPQLFRPFFSTKARGLGMGLAISRTIVEAHGGRLWARANDGSGATFAFHLPIAGEQTDGRVEGNGLDGAPEA